LAKRVREKFKKKGPKNVSEEQMEEQKDFVEEHAEQETAKQEIDEVTEEFKELASAKSKAKEWEDKFLRAHAEMQNIQRRSREERDSLIRFRSQDLAKKILPSLDGLERALATEVSDEAGESLKKGILMVQEGLLKALEEEGVEEIKAEGEKFDPNLHMAVQTVEADDKHLADTIVQILQKGYKLKDRVLRPTMVIVAS